jgi:hypothetical protein
MPVVSYGDVTAMIPAFLGVVLLVWRRPISRASCAIQRAVTGSTYDPEKQKWVWILIGMTWVLAGIAQLFGVPGRQ